MPHYKTGEVLVRITMERGIVWYVTDVILNMPVLPKNPIAKLMFGLSGSGPGLKFNNIAPLFMVADKAALRRWLADEFRKAPPAFLIATHGDIVDFAATPGAKHSLFGSQLTAPLRRRHVVTHRSKKHGSNRFGTAVAEFDTARAAALGCESRLAVVASRQQHDTMW